MRSDAIGLGPVEDLAAGTHAQRIEARAPRRQADVDACIETGCVHVGEPRARAEQVGDLGHQVEAKEPRTASHGLPAVDEGARGGQVLRTEHVEHRQVVDAQVPLVEEGGEQRVEVRLIVLGSGIGLLEEHAIRGAVPDAAPRLIGPRQAERDPRLAGLEHLGERTFEDATATAEPVVPVGERLHPVLLRELALCGTRLAQAKVVEPEVGRQVWLDMATEQGARLGGVGPLGEARPPPLVVLRDRVELRQIEGDGACIDGIHGSPRLRV
jgi:hypothetical protein